MEQIFSKAEAIELPDYKINKRSTSSREWS
jgi:hypothetical protein